MGGANDWADWEVTALLTTYKDLKIGPSKGNNEKIYPLIVAECKINYGMREGKPVWNRNASKCKNKYRSLKAKYDVWDQK